MILHANKKQPKTLHLHASTVSSENKYKMVQINPNFYVPESLSDFIIQILATQRVTADNKHHATIGRMCRYRQAEHIYATDFTVCCFAACNNCLFLE